VLRQGKDIVNIEITSNQELKSFKSRNPELTPAFIYLESNGECYPDEKWVDNPAVILGWWVYSYLDILKGGVGQGICFMEGAFDIDAVVDGNNITLKSEDGAISWIVSKEELGKALLKALNKASCLFYEMELEDIADGFNETAKLVRESM